MTREADRERTVLFIRTLHDKIQRQSIREVVEQEFTAIRKEERDRAAEMVRNTPPIGENLYCKETQKKLLKNLAARIREGADNLTTERRTGGHDGEVFSNGD